MGGGQGVDPGLGASPGRAGSWAKPACILSPPSTQNLSANSRDPTHILQNEIAKDLKSILLNINRMIRTFDSKDARLMNPQEVFFSFQDLFYYGEFENAEQPPVAPHVRRPFRYAIVAIIFHPLVHHEKSYTSRQTPLKSSALIFTLTRVLGTVRLTHNLARTIAV